MHTAKLNHGGRKITRVYRGSRKSRKTIVRCQLMLVNYTGIIINTGKKKEKTQSKIVNYTPQGYGKIYILLPKYIKSFTLGLLTDFLGRLRIL